MTSHVQLSQRAVAAVQHHLRQRGQHLVLQQLPDERMAIIALVGTGPRGGPVLAVRVSRPRWGTKHVTAHSALTGRRKRYHYRYRYCHWNLHSHGKPVAAQPDVWVLVIAGRPLREAIVVPASVVGTIKAVDWLLDGTHPRSRLAPYVGRWDVLGGAEVRRVA